MRDERINERLIWRMGGVGLGVRGERFESSEAVLERGYIMGPYFAVTSRYLPDKEQHPVRDLRGFSYMKDVKSSYDHAAVVSP